MPLKPVRAGVSPELDEKRCSIVKKLQDLENLYNGCLYYQSDRS